MPGHAFHLKWLTPCTLRPVPHLLTSYYDSYVLACGHSRLAEAQRFLWQALVQCGVLHPQPPPHVPAHAE